MPASASHEHDETIEPNAWMIDARCRGLAPTEFFPSASRGVETAQHICADCPVRVECLEYALTNHMKYGVWGGVSERERRRLLHRRRRDLLPTPHTNQHDRDGAAATSVRSPVRHPWLARTSQAGRKKLA